MNDYKGYNIVGLGTYPMVEIKGKGSGAIPNVMKGLFTTKTEAMRAVDGYLEGLKKGRKNAKTKDANTG